MGEQVAAGSKSVMKKHDRKCTLRTSYRETKKAIKKQDIKQPERIKLREKERTKTRYRPESRGKLPCGGHEKSG